MQKLPEMDGASTPPDSTEGVKERTYQIQSPVKGYSHQCQLVAMPTVVRLYNLIIM